MLLLFIAIFILIAVIYNNNNSDNINIKKLKECPDILTNSCSTDSCNCSKGKNKPKYKKIVNHNGIDKFCYYCGKKCTTEINKPNTIIINETNENYTVNDVKLNDDGVLLYTPVYAYLEGEVQDCVCDNNNTPVEKTILIQNNDGEIIEKKGYICGGNDDGSRKFKDYDLTKDIFTEITKDRTITMDPIIENDTTNIGDGSVSAVNDDFMTRIQNIVNSNINIDKINNIKQRVNNTASEICPNTEFASYYNKKIGEWVTNSNYIFEGNKKNKVALACDTENICHCPNNDEMLWQFKNNNGTYNDCKTCGKLICPNDEDVDIITYTDDNGNSIPANCSEVMYNGLKDDNYFNYFNKCQCNKGRQLKRNNFSLNGKDYICDTCEEIVNPCPANITLDKPNYNYTDRCTLDQSCQCPRGPNNELLVKYDTLYYGPSNINIKDPNDIKYKSCYVCGFPINSNVYNICEDKIICSNISSKLQTLLNDIDNEIRTQIDNGNGNYYFNNQSIIERVNEYVGGDDYELYNLDDKCLLKHTISNLFNDIYDSKNIYYLDTSNALTKRNSCADIARMSSEIDSGDGINCRYNYDEDELYTIMGKLTYDNDYNGKPSFFKSNDDKKTLSNVIKSYSDDLYHFNMVLHNCKATCNKDYKKLHGIDNDNIDVWPTESCQDYAKLYCPSYSNISEYTFAKNVYDFCLDKDDKCNALTYIKDMNNNYINDRVKKLCPNSCWKCDEDAVTKARDFIKINYPNGISDEEKSNIITSYVNESKQLREQINAGLDVLTSRSGFTKYIDDLKFNILDMVNRWDFKYKLSTDKDLYDNCKQNTAISDDKLYDDKYEIANFLEMAECNIVDSVDKIENEFISEKAQLLNGLYGYCKSPEKSNWLKSIMESCANSSSNDASPICQEIDNSNSFAFKLDGVKDCFNVDINTTDTDDIIKCVNKKLSNACVGNVRELQDSYTAKCRQDFKKCVTSMACGEFKNGIIDNTKISETQKNNPLCRKCINDAFDCSVRNQWNKKKHIKYPSNVPYTENLYTVDNCPINNDTCIPIIQNDDNAKYDDIFNDAFGFTDSNNIYNENFKKDVNNNFINCENTLRQCISPYSCSVLKNKSMKNIFDTIISDYNDDDDCIKCAWNSNSCIYFNNVKNTCKKYAGADLASDCWEKTKKWVNKRREYVPLQINALNEYNCLPTTTLCQPPKPGSLDFSFWVDNDNHEIIPEREKEFKWYVNNWWKGYPDSNPNCKGKWVLKYNNEYCDIKTCNVTDMSFHIQINENITKRIAKSNGLATHLKNAINEYIYQHQIGTYDHINTFLSKILWLTKYKSDPNPECGTVYDKYLFNDLIILINKIKNNDRFKYGLPADIRLQFDHMLTRLSNVKPENKYCRIGSNTYLTGNSKLSNVDLSYLLSSRQFLCFNDNDIKNVYNSNNPNNVITNVTLTNNNIATFKVEFKNITFDVADKIKNIFYTQNFQKYDSTKSNLFIKYLFNSFCYSSNNDFIYIFKNLLNSDQKKNSMITLIDDIILNDLSGIKSSNYVWLYEKEDASQLIDCDLAKIRGFIGEFENLNIDINIGQTYSGMTACEKNTALFFEENKCNLQQLVSEKKIACSDDIIEREKHNNSTISKLC